MQKLLSQSAVLVGLRNKTRLLFCSTVSRENYINNINILFRMTRMTNPETEDPEVIPITGPPT